MSAAGCSYFGVRIVRHVRRDMADLAARGYTGVLHTVSENDLAYYRGTMAEIFEASHAEGLTVQVSPWGLGRTFGGEAESRFVAFHPEACQVMDDGRRVAAACLNQPAYRAFCKEWADAVLEMGADSVFWDEPAWVVPVHVGVDDEARWTCRCDVCAERFGGPLPTELTPEARAFREASVVDFLREVVAHVADRGGSNTICLLPATEGTQGISDWDSVAVASGADDVRDRSVLEALGRAGRPVRQPLRAPAARDLRPPRGRRAAVAAELRAHPRRDPGARGSRRRRARGRRDDLWTWGYEACGHMTSLATPDAPLVWDAISAALTRRSQKPTESASPRFADLELRSARELVRLLNEEDATVPGAVADAGAALAVAIDGIVGRLGSGGRLIYVGAGTSGRLAALDAAECGPTFGSPPGEVVAVVPSGAEEDEDDAERGAADLAAIGPGRGDAVVAVTASGSTPYVLAALETAKRAGALRVAVVCVRGSAAGALADHEVVVVVGPEAIAGSTRLKAGTAQKLVLNTISTVTMIRLGRTYGGLMVGVAQDNAKLRERARRNLMLASGASEEDVDAALAQAGGDAKVALVSLLAGVDTSTARERLDGAGGSVRLAVGDRR